jgi:hypothetical protein
MEARRLEELRKFILAVAARVRAQIDLAVLQVL